MSEEKKNITYHKGYDSFSSDPGTVSSGNCLACGVVLDVKRNVDGPTSWAEAVGKKSHLHDSFTCPNAGEDWHTQLIKLMEYRKSLPSRRLRDIIDGEIDELKLTRVSTVKCHPLF